MKKNEILKLIEKLEDNAEIDEVLFSNGFEQTITENNITEALKRNSALSKYVDQRVTGAVKTFKEGDGFKNAIDKAVREATGQNKTPEMIEIEKLKAEIEANKKEKAESERKIAVSKALNSRKLDTRLLDFVTGSDDESIKNQLDTLQNIISNSNSAAIKDKLGESNYNPPLPAQTGGKVTWEEVLNDPTKMEVYIKQENK